MQICRAGRPVSLVIERIAPNFEVTGGMVSSRVLAGKRLRCWAGDSIGGATNWTTAHDKVIANKLATKLGLVDILM